MLALLVPVLGLDDGDLEFGAIGGGDDNPFVVAEDHCFFEGPDVTSSGFSPFAVDHSFEDSGEESFHASFVPAAFFGLHCFISHIVLWQPTMLR